MSGVRARHGHLENAPWDTVMLRSGLVSYFPDLTVELTGCLSPSVLIRFGGFPDAWPERALGEKPTPHLGLCSAVMPPASEFVDCV